MKLRLRHLEDVGVVRIIIGDLGCIEGTRDLPYLQDCRNFRVLTRGGWDRLIIAARRGGAGAGLGTHCPVRRSAL